MALGSEGPFSRLGLLGNSRLLFPTRSWSKDSRWLQSPAKVSGLLLSQLFGYQTDDGYRFAGRKSI